MLFYDAVNPAPNPRRVRIYLAEKGLTVPSEKVSIPKGEHKGEAYRAVQGNSLDSRLLVQRAHLDLLAGDPASARSTLEAVPRTAPAYAQAQALLSNVYLVQNRKTDSRIAAQRAVDANPGSPSALLALSLVEQSSFRLQAARYAAGQARALDPRLVQADIQYAILQFGFGETAKAEQVLRQAIGAAPREAR